MQSVILILTNGPKILRRQASGRSCCAASQKARTISGSHPKEVASHCLVGELSIGPFSSNSQKGSHRGPSKPTLDPPQDLSTGRVGCFRLRRFCDSRHFLMTTRSLAIDGQPIVKSAMQCRAQLVNCLVKKFEGSSLATLHQRMRSPSFHRVVTGALQPAGASLLLENTCAWWDLILTIRAPVSGQEERSWLRMQ